MIVRPAPPEHYGWIAERATLVITPAFRAIEAVDASGRIAGMIAYDGWTPNACCIHIALDYPGAFRHLLRPAFGIPFVEFGKGVLCAQVLSTNTRSLALVRHVGFRESGRLRDGWERGVDLVFFEMRREECRWIPQPRAKEAA